MYHVPTLSPISYEILSDSNNRAVYDERGMDGLSGGGSRGGPNADDIFAQFFGGGGGGPGGPFPGFSFGFDMGGGPSRRKNDSIIPHQVTLEDLYNGKIVKMNMEKQVLCGTCKGSGAKGNAKPKPCSSCEGNGYIFVKTPMIGGSMAVTRDRCSDCEGSGEKLREKDRCKKCKGSKTVKEKTRQELHIEKGMADLQRIVLAGGGDEQPNIPAGDVVFVLKAQPHESFERNGNDLLVHVKITLSEALLGFSRILVTHLDGRGIKVASSPGKILQPDASIIIRGEGMPVFKRPDMKGDLFVLFEIEMPDADWLRSIDRRALEKLLPPKKPEMVPEPENVVEVNFEEIDREDVHDDEWEDDDDEEEEDDEEGMYDRYGGHAEPDCRQQ
ncbi:hypothetical protein D9757_001513 [Collybiopsis confluens]|uniref:CR-type domain-containing protein n=1 Tax=Collybiopsis confluens TaxID=2823264 RepID=A0A8H5MFN8_9AGAR|nr:hypothetical protein D9757_001513 [Collybiopsis confluens]